MNLPTLRREARNVIDAYEKLDEKLRGKAYEHLKPEQRRNLLGPDPVWARYVLALGEPGTAAIITRAQAQQQFGSIKNMRAVALRLLAIADEVAEYTPPIPPTRSVA